MASPKKVHFSPYKSNALTIIIITIERSTPKDICGDTQLALRNIKSEDPDYGMIAQMRTQRLISFRTRAGKERGFRTEHKKLFDAFCRLKVNKAVFNCDKCNKELSEDTLTLKQIKLFGKIPLCPLCRNILTFEIGTFRCDVEDYLTSNNIALF